MPAIVEWWLFIGKWSGLLSWLGMPIAGPMPWLYEAFLGTFLFWIVLTILGGLLVGTVKDLLLIFRG